MESALYKYWRDEDAWCDPEPYPGTDIESNHKLLEAYGLEGIVNGDEIIMPDTEEGFLAWVMKDIPDTISCPGDDCDDSMDDIHTEIEFWRKDRDLPVTEEQKEMARVFLNQL